MAARTSLAILAVAATACCPRPGPPAGPPAPAAISSPGPLADVHATLACDACHVDATREIANAKCLDCHEHTGLRMRMAAGQGFHATAGVRDRPCAMCHLDHRGGSYDLRGWRAMTGGEQAFDHDLTGWPLHGTHATTDCARCHPTTDRQGLRTYVGVDRACASCHQSPHVGTVYDGRACERCHSPRLASLTAVDFEHATFALGAHHKLACARCHTPALGAAAPSPVCTTCHANDSPHGTRFKAFGSPPACSACHTSGSWRPTAFDHGRETKFALWGRHADIACRACHRGTSPDEFERFKRGTKCMGCHAHAKVHANVAHPEGQFTNDQCLQCHRPGEPRPNPGLVVAHGVGSRFPLVKRHAAVRCIDCHADGGSPGTDAGSPECGERCHVDAHDGARGATCSGCHTPGTWEVADPP